MSDKTQDHTKTPWDGKEGQIYSEGDGKTIVYIPYYDEDNKRDRANAAFICQAVNSHEALVEAVNELLLGSETVVNDDGQEVILDVGYFADCISQVYAALESIKGKE